MASEGTTAFQVRLPPQLHRALNALASREGTSMNYEATVAIRAHLDADKQRRSAGK